MHQTFDHFIHLRRAITVFAASAMSALFLYALNPEPAAGQRADWPYWRGPHYDGVAQASGLPEDWDPRGGEGSNVLWSRSDIGGPCTPIVMDGRLYTIQRAEPDTPREGEQVVCLDAKTGETLWENRFNVWLSDVPAERIGWSSVVGDQETGYIYALGSCDIFQCIDGKTGETIWSVPLHEQFGMLNTYGGRTNFPVLHEDLVIISGVIINWGEYAKPNHRLIGMNKLTGEAVWFTGTTDLPYDTSYSSPTVTTIDGQRQLIMGTGDGRVWGFQPRTGKPLWNYELSLRGIYASPLVVGDQVFIGQSEENVGQFANVMGTVAALRVSGTGDKTKVSEDWKHLEVVAGYSEPVKVDDRIYWLDDRCKMWIFDAETGEIIMEQKAFVGNRQRASLLYADHKIYVLSENGPWAIIEPTEDGFEVLSKGRIRDGGFSASPIVADGRLYFPSTTTLYCVASEGSQQQQVLMAQTIGDETPVSEYPQATQLQIVPVESLVKPGEQVELSIMAYNAIGQRVELPKNIQLSVAGPGRLEGNTFIANDDVAHTGAVITASSDSATGVARVRIVPPLPWKFTFDGLKEPPLSWVGARYRHVIRDVDGSPALTKVNTIPKGARSLAWMGPSDLANYTMTADVRATRMSNQLPDIGLTSHGYALDLMGQSQQLQLRTWSAQLRLLRGDKNSTVPFAWKEDVWYRIKFRVDIESEPPAATALLRGKVWPRDEPEPEEWTVTTRDEAPNLNASPGLYGNAKVAEFFMDNIEVTSNEDE